MNENSTTPTEGGQPAKESPTFDVLPLSDEVRRAIAEMGYTHPTPVQVAVWEPATRGKDAVVQARTGTGKTASFGLPIVDHLIKRANATVQALVLCPTRELALQVAGEVERLGKYREVKVLPIYGGASMERQLAGIQAGAQLVVGTPGRVLDHIRRGTLDTKGIRLLVLDEADEMLSMGFERELSAILEALPPSRQTLLFSATVPSAIERIARNRLKSPEFVTLSGDHIGALEIAHYVYMVNADKLGSLVRVLEAENPESAVIFCNTKEETETVAAALSQRGFDADWLNGDLAQSDREKVMTATKQGKLRFLVATDVAARGIDISHLTHVINYGFPLEAEAYVHRTGRTGRAGRTGTAISLITPQDVGSLYYLRLTYKIRPIERQIPTLEELRTRAETDLLAMLAETLPSKGIESDDRTLARRLLAHDHSELLVAGLLRSYLEQAPKAQQDADRLRRQPKRSVAKRAAPSPGRPDVRPVAPPPPAVTAPAPAPVDNSITSSSRVTDVPPPRPAADAPAATTEPKPTEVRERPRRDRDRDRDRDRERGGPRPPRGRTEPRGGEAREARPAREPARDFTQWSPPEEEGDDEPLLPARAGGARADRRPPRAPASGLHTEHAEPGRSADDALYVELFVGVGRRDGARAQDVLRALVETAKLDKDSIRRIRVRDRHTFVGVRKEDADRAIGSLGGATIGSKSGVNVELARERPADGVSEAAAEG